MTDLDDRIHEDLERLVASAPLPPSVEEITDGRSTVERRRRPVLVGVAAAVVVLAAVVGAVALRQTGDDGPDGAAAQAGEPDLVIYLRPDVTPSQTQAVSNALAAEPTVVSVDFVDQEEAYQEFQELHADDRQLIGSVSPDVLPPSFRVHVRDHDLATAETVAEVMWTMAGVREIEVQPEPPPDPPISVEPAPTDECGDRTLDTVPDPCAPPAPEDGDFLEVSPDGACEAGYVPFDRDNDGGIESCLAEEDASMVESCGRLHMAVDSDGDGVLDDCVRMRDGG